MTPEERVRRFMAAMTSWEPTAVGAVRSGTAAERAAVKSSLQAIYEEHLSAKGKSAARFGRNLVGPGPSVQEPPKFDQDIEKTENAPRKGVFYVITKPRHDPNTAWRFTVVVDAQGDAKVDDLHGAVARNGEVIGEWEKYGY